MCRCGDGKMCRCENLKMNNQQRKGTNHKYSSIYKKPETLKKKHFKTETSSLIFN